MRADPYHWMRRTDSPALLAHLEAERLWYDTATGHLNSLVETMRSEMLGRVPATDRSVSWRLQGCSYYTALPAGREHQQLLRERNGSESRARGAPRRQRPGRRLGVRRARALPGQPRPEAAGLLGGPHRRRGLRAAVPRPRDRRRTCPTWRRAPTTAARGAAGRTTSSTRSTTTAYRPFQVWRHALGTPVADDVLVLEEPDERFELNVRATRSEALVVIWAESRDTNEVWVLDAAVADVVAALGRAAGARASSTTPSTSCFPTARTRCCWSPTTTPPSSGWPAVRCPATPTRTTRPGRRPGPSAPTSG